MFASRSSLRTRHLGLVLLGCGLLGNASCLFEEGEDGGSEGTLVVPFELGNRRSCESFDVERVRGELVEGSDYVDEVRCDTGQLRFQGVRAGNYRVRLYGLDEEGVAVMDNRLDDETLLKVIGHGNTVVADRPVKLTRTPAHMYLRWTFGFGTCKSAGISGFAISVWRSDGSELLLETELDCELDGEGPEGYREVSERGLIGDQIGEVTVQPLDTAGFEIGDPVVFEFMAPGAGRDIKLSVTCEDTNCTGSGEPD